MEENETIEALRKQVLELESKLHDLKRQVSFKDATLHEKNLSLDAYHHVWCTGACARGIHRYHDEELTEAVVLEAERNTKRLRQRYNNERWSKIWKQLTPEERRNAMRDQREWRVVVQEIADKFVSIHCSVRDKE